MTELHLMPARMKAITASAAAAFGVTVEAVVGRVTRHAPSHARDAAWAQMRSLTMANGRPPSHQQIAGWFGRTRVAVLIGERRHWKREGEARRYIETERAA